MYAQEMIQLIQSGKQGQTAAPDVPAQLCQTCAELSQSQLSKNNTGVNLPCANPGGGRLGFRTGIRARIRQA